jgi:hypothetical protein
MMLLVFSRTHVVALYGHLEDFGFLSSYEHGMGASLPSLSLVVVFYMHSVLDFWEGRRRIERPLLFCALEIVKNDADRTEDDIRRGNGDRNLWFWKLFIGALSLAQHEMEHARDAYPESTAEQGSSFAAMRVWFEGRIRNWAAHVKIETWHDAKGALKQVTWPNFCPRESLAEEMWNGALVDGKSHTELFDISKLTRNRSSSTYAISHRLISLAYLASFPLKDGHARVSNGTVLSCSNHVR